MPARRRRVRWGIEGEILERDLPMKARRVDSVNRLEGRR